MWNCLAAVFLASGWHYAGYLIGTKDIGYMPQEIALYPDLTVHDNLTIFGKLFGLNRSELSRNESELLEFIDLSEKRDCQR